MRQPTDSKEPHFQYYTLCSNNALSARKQPIRLCTLYHKDKTSSLIGSSSRNVMEIYLYTETNVYFNVVKINDMNQELNWNQKFIELLKRSLAGRNKNSIVQFDARTYALRFYSQINDNSIRILLFQIGLVDIRMPPFTHAQDLLRKVNRSNTKVIAQLQAENKFIKDEMEKISALTKQIKEQSQFEINQAKEKFICLINEVKGRLRPHFGITEDIKEEQDKTSTQARPIFRIKSANSVSATRQSENLFNLFD